MDEKIKNQEILLVKEKNDTKLNVVSGIANIFVERFWRTVKYEYLYIRSFDDGAVLYRGLAVFMGYYNERRTHQGFGRGVTSSMRYKGFFGESSKQALAS
ncbi:MAG: integrase core domain-containing protein [Mucinivorans sp.]